METITTEQIDGGFQQMTAPSGYYLTQAHEVSEHERLYVRVRLLLGTEQIAHWRLAPDAEAAEHQQRMEQRYSL